jgi:hypothetical protein
MNDQIPLLSEFIVKVLLAHPFDGDNDPLLQEAKKGIKARYRELRSEKSFTESEIQAKSEWLESFLQKIT